MLVNINWGGGDLKLEGEIPVHPPPFVCNPVIREALPTTRGRTQCNLCGFSGNWKSKWYVWPRAYIGVYKPLVWLKTDIKSILGYGPYMNIMSTVKTFPDNNFSIYNSTSTLYTATPRISKTLLCCSWEEKKQCGFSSKLKINFNF